jgi:hypothetical protein
MKAMRLKPTLLGVGALLAVQTLAGCSSISCTTIGASSGVSVATPSLPRSAPLVIEVCVGTTCTTNTSVADVTMPLFVVNDALTSEEPTDLTVAIRSKDGKTLVPATHVVTHPVKHQPNGPDCQPTAYVVAVTAGVKGVVETRPAQAP